MEVCTSHRLAVLPARPWLVGKTFNVNEAGMRLAFCVLADNALPGGADKAKVGRCSLTPCNPRLFKKTPGTKRLKLRCDKLLIAMLPQFCFQIQRAPLQQGGGREPSAGGGDGAAQAQDQARAGAQRQRAAGRGDGRSSIRPVSAQPKPFGQ
jgi:hypothetical protein